MGKRKASIMSGFSAVWRRLKQEQPNLTLATRKFWNGRSTSYRKTISQLLLAWPVLHLAMHVWCTRLHNSTALKSKKSQTWHVLDLVQHVVASMADSYNGKKEFKLMARIPSPFKLRRLRIGLICMFSFWWSTIAKRK